MKENKQSIKQIKAGSGSAKTVVFRVKPLAVALAGVLSVGLLAPGSIHQAQAGAGWAERMGEKDGSVFSVPTYYASSPSGLRNPTECFSAPPPNSTWNGTDQPSIVTGTECDTGKALRKFVDSLPLVKTATNNYVGNNLGQMLVKAEPNTTKYPGSDYYEIGVKQYTEQMHSDLVEANGVTQHPTKLRGYVQLVEGTTTPVAAGPHYLGPIIVAQQGRPVRIKYTNLLPNGDLFLPFDTTLDGSDIGPDGVNKYKQNRAELHLHGGDTPWVSDGTPHQWTVPAAEGTQTQWLNPKGTGAYNKNGPYLQGASFVNVPDMPDPGAGSGTLYYPNGLSGRLMFYHDHALALTRLNVYAGEEASYLVTDSAERAINTALGLTLGTTEVPLAIQDRSFVPKDISRQDAKWDTTHWGQTGDLWFPHVYERNQSPSAYDGQNAPGRWDWGPWFWPISPATLPLPTGDYGDVSTTPEAFGDTPMVNGTAYPYMVVQPSVYRFRVLNASNDRTWNLGLYKAEPLSVRLVSGGKSYKAAPTVTVYDGGNATAMPVLSNPTNPDGSSITSIAVVNAGSGYTTPEVVISDPTGSGATAHATTSGTSITGIVVDTTGSKYTAPVVSIAEGGTNPGATVIAKLNNDKVVTGFTVTNPGTFSNGYPPVVKITNASGDNEGIGASALAAAGTEVSMIPFIGPNNPNTTGYTCPASGWTETTSNGDYNYPASYPCGPTNGGINGQYGGGLAGSGWGQQDNRQGGVPNPLTAGPDIIQIGSEGGILPEPAVIPSTIVNYQYNKKNIVVLNVLEKGLNLGAAERADILVDFSGLCPGSKYILYNDAGAPVPAEDPRQNYYTGNADQTTSGGQEPTKPGLGPNTRTVMQFRVAGTFDPTCVDIPKSSLFNRQSSIVATVKPLVEAAYAAKQEAPVVAESAYNNALGQAWTDSFAKIQTGSSSVPFFEFTAGSNITFKTLAATVMDPPFSYGQDMNNLQSATQQTTVPKGYWVKVTQGNKARMNVYNKAIQELFDTHGRLNATLGVELPFTNGAVQTTIPLNYIDPPTESIVAGETQLWKITHNGVDTHPVHFHLQDVQVVNRVGWDGAIRTPDATEIGWKETVKMSPLEDIIVAVRPRVPVTNTGNSGTGVNFGVPTSNRLLDPTIPYGSTLGFTQIDPNTGNPATVRNVMYNFYDEYVWHCHILGHEENDFMRSYVFNRQAAVPDAPVNVTATSNGAGTEVTVTFNDVADTEYQYVVERFNGGTAGPMLTGTKIATLPANAGNAALAVAVGGGTNPWPGTVTDSTTLPGTQYTYQVVAIGASGKTAANSRVTTTSPCGSLVELTNLTPSYNSATPRSVTLTWANANQVTCMTDYVGQRAQYTVNSTTGVATLDSYAALGVQPAVAALTVQDKQGVPGGNTVAANVIYGYSLAAQYNSTTGPTTTTTIVTGALPAPGNTTSPVTHTTGSNNAVLNWTAGNSASQVNVTGYQIMRCVGSSTFCTDATKWNPLVTTAGAGQAGNKVQYTDNTLTDATGTQYRYRINAVTVIGGTVTPGTKSGDIYMTGKVVGGKTIISSSQNGVVSVTK